jgi:Trypsin
MTCCSFDASTKIHSRSPVRPSPDPVCPPGSGSPWTSPAASHASVTRCARSGWRRDRTLSRIRSLNHSLHAASCRTRQGQCLDRCSLLGQCEAGYVAGGCRADGLRPEPGPAPVCFPSLHPSSLQWNERAEVYDAAVLKLSRPVKGIKPIKPATAKQNNLEKPGHILTTAGWGVVKQRPGPFDILPFRMHEVSVPVVSDSRAKRTYKSQSLKYLPSLHVAAGKKGNGPCFGDSGGPLFDSGSRTQVGITSYGAGGCGQASYPAVYTEVNNAQIGKWILSAAKR